MGGGGVGVDLAEERKKQKTCSSCKECQQNFTKLKGVHSVLDWNLVMRVQVPPGQYRVSDFVTSSMLNFILFIFSSKRQLVAQVMHVTYQ